MSEKPKKIDDGVLAVFLEHVLKGDSRHGDFWLVTERGLFTRVNGVEKFVPWEDGEGPHCP